ncbi:hypothetical protein BKA59DRAFT_476683 [Fusarium tricinctum]|uniref:Uncharacterized protein n=1 Tax=Fusarium tricinctum TaxID=61284 RepID=A0A8K0WCY9_9HYPO|nr:hypothetical protein BKA59DRAFT_476683 [Fusarium tricinctum]
MGCCRVGLCNLRFANYLYTTLNLAILLVSYCAVLYSSLAIQPPKRRSSISCVVCLFLHSAYGVQRCHVRSFLSRRPSSLKGVHRKQQGYTTPTTKGLLPARPAFAQFLDLTTFIHRIVGGIVIYLCVVLN